MFFAVSTRYINWFMCITCLFIGQQYVGAKPTDTKCSDIFMETDTSNGSHLLLTSNQPHSETHNAVLLFSKDKRMILSGELGLKFAKKDTLDSQYKQYTTISTKPKLTLNLSFAWGEFMSGKLSIVGFPGYNATQNVLSLKDMFIVFALDPAKHNEIYFGSMTTQEICGYTTLIDHKPYISLGFKKEFADVIKAGTLFLSAVTGTTSSEDDDIATPPPYLVNPNRNNILVVIEAGIKNMMYFNGRFGGGLAYSISTLIEPDTTLQNASTVCVGLVSSSFDISVYTRTISLSKQVLFLMVGPTLASIFKTSATSNLAPVIITVEAASKDVIPGLGASLTYVYVSPTISEQTLLITRLRLPYKDREQLAFMYNCISLEDSIYMFSHRIYLGIAKRISGHENCVIKSSIGLCLASSQIKSWDPSIKTTYIWNVGACYDI